MKKTFYYITSILVGFIFAYNAVTLPQTSGDKQVVDVKVNVPKPTLIHDTIIKPDVKYKYIYRNICCCSSCSNDSIK